MLSHSFLLVSSYYSAIVSSIGHAMSSPENLRRAGGNEQPAVEDVPTDSKRRRRKKFPGLRRCPVVLAMSSQLWKMSRPKRSSVVFTMGIDVQPLGLDCGAGFFR
jgi:hypothetical protein